jgi:hypothetical protein
MTRRADRPPQSERHDYHVLMDGDDGMNPMAVPGRLNWLEETLIGRPQEDDGPGNETDV